MESGNVVPTSRFRIAGRALLVAGGLAAAAGIAEGYARRNVDVGVRHLLHRPDRTSRFRAEVLPGSGARFTSFATNAVGLRASPLPGPGVRRILAVGGSSTECLFLDDPEAWPAVLETLLRARSREGGWVGNAGKSGLNTFSHRSQVFFHLAELRPDVVILAPGINDMNQWLSGGRRAVEDNDRFGREEDYEEGYARWVFDEILPPRERSRLALVDLVRRRFDPPPPPRPFADSVVQDAVGNFYAVQRARRAAAAKVAEMPPGLDTGLAAFERNLDRIATLCSRAGVPLVLVTQPSLYREDLTKQEEALLWFGAVDENPFAPRAPGRYYAAPVLARTLSAYNDRIRAVARGRRIGLWDAAREIPSDTTVFYDDCHFTPEGARRMAEGLSEYLVTRGGLAR